jgi:hypothetical protein
MARPMITGRPRRAPIPFAMRLSKPNCLHNTGVRLSLTYDPLAIGASPTYTNGSEATVR